MNKFKQLLKNATTSVATTLLGSIIGLPQIIEGISTNNVDKIIIGFATFLLGLFAKENNE